MNKVLKLTLAAINKNIAQQQKLKDQVLKDILNQCPFKVGENVYLVRGWDGYKSKVKIRFIFISDTGEYIYKLSAYNTLGRRMNIDIMPNHHIEKIQQKQFDYENIKHRFNRIN